MAQRVSVVSGSTPVEARTVPAPLDRRRASSRIFPHLAVLAAYTVPSVVLWWRVWSGHPSGALTCACGDAGQTVWFLAWPAHALAHGLDPFFSGALNAPHGVNLLANASSLLVGVVLTPVTLGLGALTATNVALTLCPVLSAWACWVACRRLVRWPGAAFVAGLLFGFSPFVVTNVELGHLGLGLLVVPPLLVPAVCKLLFGPPGHAARSGFAVGILLVVQFFVSAEILAITVFLGAPLTVLAAVVGRRHLVPMRVLARGVAAAAGTAAPLAVPAWFALEGPQHVVGRLWPGAGIEGNPLVTFWDPGAYGARATTLQQLGGYLGLRGPPSAYVGPVVLCLAASALVVCWRRRAAWLLAASAVLSGALSLGALLVTSPGHAVAVWLPWRLFATLPLLENVIPQRFSAVTDLCVALLAGLALDAAWHAAAGARCALLVRGACVVAAAVALGSSWWTYQVPLVAGVVSVPRWYDEAGGSLAPGTRVLSVPFPFPADGTSGPMVWQALDGMAFRLVGGYAKVPGPTGAPLSSRLAPAADLLLARLSGATAGPLPSGSPAQVAVLRHALEAWRPGVVVVSPRVRDPGRAVSMLSRALGAPPVRTRGSWVWRITAGSGSGASSGGP